MRPTFRKVYGRTDPARVTRAELAQAARRNMSPSFLEFFARFEEQILKQCGVPKSLLVAPEPKLPKPFGDVCSRDRFFAFEMARVWALDDKKWRADYAVPITGLRRSITVSSL